MMIVKRKSDGQTLSTTALISSQDRYHMNEIIRLYGGTEADYEQNLLNPVSAGIVVDSSSVSQQSSGIKVTKNVAGNLTVEEKDNSRTHQIEYIQRCLSRMESEGVSSGDIYALLQRSKSILIGELGT